MDVYYNDCDTDAVKMYCKMKLNINFDVLQKYKNKIITLPKITTKHILQYYLLNKNIK